MAVTVTRTAFSKGEITPRLYGRTDVEAFFYACQKAENVAVLEEGGLRNRVGTRFIAPVKTHDKNVRLVPFNFGGIDTHVLEFGDYYMRVLRDDYHLTETARNITGATQADPCVLTVTAHGYSTGDEIFVSGVGGMIELNARRFTVTVLDANTFSIQSQYDGTDINSTGYETYTSGGTVAKIYEIETQYAHADLFDVKFSQSFDVIFMRHPDYPPVNLQRLGLTNWQFVDAVPKPNIDAPSSVSLTVNSSGSETYRYAVTAVSGDTGEESLTGLSGTSLTITGVTQANPAVVTISSATSVLRTGHEVEVSGVVGMTELNGRRFQLVRLSSTEFQLRGIDSTGFGAYISGGSCAPAFVHTASGNTTTDNTVTWNVVPGATKYVVYREKDGLFAFLGETQDTQFIDKNIDPDLSDTAPGYRNPFFGAGNYPGAIGSFQQRAVEAGSNNAKASLDFSVSGAFNNFNRSAKPKDDDAFRITLAARSETKILHLVETRDLMSLNESSIKRIYTNGQGLSFNTVAIEGPNEIGASQVRPIPFNQKVLFEDNLKTGLYAAEFSFAVDAVNVEQLSAFSEHMWDEGGLVDWTRVKGENQFILGTRSDGQAICFTYNPGDQFQVSAFTRWVLNNGKFKSITSVRSRLNERTESIYAVVERVVNGNTVRYIEVIRDDHDPQLIEDCYYVDSGLTYASEVNVTAVSSDAEAVFTSNAHGFTNGQEVRLRGFEWQGEYDSLFNFSPHNDLNGLVCKISDVTTDTFKLKRIEDDSYLSGAPLPTYVGFGKAGLRTSKLYGFDHLVGQTVVALLDGDVTEELTVNADGSVDLPRPGAVVSVGLRIIADIQTLPLVDLRGSIEQSKESSLRELYVDVYRSRGMLVGPRFERMTPWAQREFENYGEPTRRKSGVTKQSITAEWSTEASLCIRQADPLPMTIRSISTENEQPR